MKRIGIPRALHYYEYLPMWQTFFRELGAEVVISPPTTHAVLVAGTGRVVAETCLPVKVYLGHVISLCGKCDQIFIPAIRSIKHKVYNCSKFLGLPDMTRAVVPEAPPILEIDIDITAGKQAFHEAIFKLGLSLTKNPLTINRAARAARQAHLDYRQKMIQEGLTPLQALSGESIKKEPGTGPTIGLIGHPYLLYDEYVNQRVQHRLQQAGCNIITPEMVEMARLEKSVNALVDKAYWTYEEYVVGAGGHFIDSGVDGVIGVMAFSCGPDSVMMDVVHRYARRASVPFMCLTLEEHSAEAGVITRLEAFVDMLARRRKKAGICA